MKEKEETKSKDKNNGFYGIAMRLAIVSLLICGLFYPIFVTGVSQTIMPSQANGNLARLQGQPVGSYLIDNGFTAPMFFHTRNESNPLTASASGVDPDIVLSYLMKTCEFQLHFRDVQVHSEYIGPHLLLRS